MSGARTCRRCGEKPVREPTGLCGWCVELLDLRALTALQGPPPHGSFAIFHLRDRGYSPEQITKAEGELAEGVSVDDVHRRLRGVGEAVAA